MDIGQITNTEINQVLRQVLGGRSLSASCLIQLESVEAILEGSADRATRDSRDWALGVLLMRLTWAELPKLRSYLMADGSSAASDETAQAAVERDFLAGSADLEAWSCLYYRYLAPATLQVQELAAIAQPGAPHGRRLINRRLERGYTLLANALRSRERDVRSTNAPNIEHSPAQAEAGTPSRSVLKTTQLPAPTSSFIGRVHEIDALAAALPGTRLLTLTGLGGSGKTRLALEVAHRVQQDFAQGATFVDFSAISDAELLPQTVASAFGMTLLPRNPPEESLQSALSARHLLLVFDNCERLVEPISELVDGLLRVCHRLKILATSREALLLPGEKVWPVPPLGHNVGSSAGAADATALRDDDAVRLFVERARAGNPSFDPSDDTLAIVGRICSRLDRIPLAIELAAARIRHLTATEILARLEDRFKLMRTTTRGIPLRHQTLHASLQSSYELLDEAEQRLFRRLSVFRGGWTLPAAEAVCDDPEACDVPVMERLGRLLDKSLVRVHQATEGSRYSFLESVAAARAQLEGAGEAEEFDDRLTNWCLDLVAAAEPHLRSEEQSDWLALLGREGDNLRLAVRRVLNAGDGPTALRFTALLWPSWRRKSTVDGWNMLEEALRLPGAELPGPDRLRALIAASFAAALCGTFERAMDHAHAAVELARGLEDRRSEVVAMYSWSATLVAFGDRDEGERQLATAIELAELEADPVLIGMVCSEIGWSAMARGEYARALAFLERGLDNLRQAGDLMEEALTLSRLGVLAIAVNDLDRAEERLRESMGLRERIGDRAGIAQVLNNLGCVYEDRGDFEAAAEAYEGSRDLALELGHGTHYGIAASNVCLARLLLGDVEGAKHQMREFFHMTVGALDPVSLLFSHEISARILLAEGRFEQAAAILFGATSLRERSGMPLPKHEQDGWYSEALQRLANRLAHTTIAGIRADVDTMDIDELGNRTRTALES